jgi:TPP-dependent pyruvate/acetoin dehydrogenase alpha subunit
MPRNKRTSNVVAMPAALNPNEGVSRPASSPDASDIARRAYEIYESRVRVDGNDVEDWLQAERELQAMAVRAS